MTELNKAQSSTKSTAPSNQLNIKFFALIREQVGVDSLIEPYVENDTVGSVRARLASKSEAFQMAFDGPLVMACNQTIVGESHSVQAGDEIAFFPPVTGG